MILIQVLIPVFPRVLPRIQVQILNKVRVQVVKRMRAKDRINKVVKAPSMC